MSGHGREPIPGWPPTTIAGADRPAWAKVGVISAVLSCVVGLLAAWLSAQLGFPSASGWVALLSGAVVLVLVGRHYRVRTAGTWIQASVVMVAILLLVVGVGSCVAAIAQYG